MPNLGLIFTSAIPRQLRGGPTFHALIAGFAAPSTTLDLRLRGDLPAVDEHRATGDRGGALLKTLVSLIAVAGIGFAISATAQAPWPLPPVATHTVPLTQFGLQVTLPSAWKLEPGQKRTDFVATHADTGATLAGAVTVSAPPVPELDSLIDKFIEDQRVRLAMVENISRGAVAVGLLDARWVKLSFSRQGEPLRMKTVAVQRGLSTLTLTCTGGVSAQKACDATIRSVTMAR